jgi:hypothetical protein
MDIEKILGEYRNGDAGCRLCLFLAFRDLRGHFSRIEQESPSDDFDILKFPWSKNYHIVRAA